MLRLMPLRVVHLASAVDVPHRHRHLRLVRALSTSLTRPPRPPRPPLLPSIRRLALLFPQPCWAALWARLVVASRRPACLKGLCGFVDSSGWSCNIVPGRELCSGRSICSSTSSRTLSMQSESCMLLITDDKHASHKDVNKFLRPILGLVYISLNIQIPLVQAHSDRCG